MLIATALEPSVSTATQLTKTTKVAKMVKVLQTLFSLLIPLTNLFKIFKFPQIGNQGAQPAISEKDQLLAAAGDVLDNLIDLGENAKVLKRLTQAINY